MEKKNKRKINYILYGLIGGFTVPILAIFISSLIGWTPYLLVSVFLFPPFGELDIYSPFSLFFPVIFFFVVGCIFGLFIAWLKNLPDNKK